MNLIRLLSVVTCFAFLGTANAQNVKPLFKKLILASYRPVGSGDKESIRIENYLEIDENGILNYRVNVFKGSYYDNLQYDGSMADTTYHVPDSLIANLNRVFNGKRKLKDYMITDKLPKGAKFAGPFEFFSYKADNDVADNLVVVSGFLDKELLDLMNKMFRLRFPRNKQIDKVYPNKPVEALILENHLACKYAPQIVAPPTMNFLMKSP